jgi:hypothetical protein
MHESNWANPPRYVSIKKQRGQDKQAGSMMDVECFLTYSIGSINWIFYSNIKKVKYPRYKQEESGQMVSP